MKKLILTIILLSLFLGQAFAAPKSKKNKELEPIQIEPIVQTDEYGTIYQTSPQLDIIGIICRLADYEIFSGNSTDEDNYITRIDNFFSKYKEHKAVKKAKYLKQKGLQETNILSIAYYIKPDFTGTTIDIKDVYNFLYNPNIKFKENDIEEFVMLVHTFVKDTNYERISILFRPDLLASVGYIKHNCEKYFVTKYSNNFFNSSNCKQDIIVVSNSSPYYWFNTFNKINSNEYLQYTTINPNFNFSALTEAYYSTQTVELSKLIWDDVKDNFTTLYKKRIRKLSNDNNDYENRIKNLQLDNYSLNHYLFYFSLLEFLKSNDYLEASKKDDYPITYNSLYNYLEKYIDEDYFYDMVNLADEYSNNRNLYPSILDFAPKIKTFINSIESEE